MKKSDLTLDVQNVIDDTKYKLSSASALLLPLIDYVNELLEVSQRGDASLVVYSVQRNMLSIQVLTDNVNQLLNEAQAELDYSSHK